MYKEDQTAAISFADAYFLGFLLVIADCFRYNISNTFLEVIMARQNYNSDWDNLGKAIENMVNQAVNSRDYQELNEKLCRTLSDAVDSGSEAMRRAMAGAFDSGASAVKRAAQEAQDRRKYVVEPKKPSYQHRSAAGSSPLPNPKPILYGNTGSKSAFGVVKTVFGACLTATGGGSALLVALAGLGGIGSSFISVAGGISAAFFLGGVGLLTSGIGGLTRIARFKQYMKALGNQTHVKLETLARLTGKGQNYTRRDVQKMIDAGYFLQGHLDNEGTLLITSDETYETYETSRLQLEAQQAQKRMAALTESQKQIQVNQNPQLREVLDKGNDFLRQIKSSNDAIPGEEISNKIFRMEAVVEKIFQRAAEHPEIIPDLKKLMDYYLPMTVKLLKAYEEMDSTQIEGGTVAASKKEIEDTLDTLNLAFEKLLDSIFKDTAMDVSSDISVLQTLLAQEGLTDDEITKHNNLQ